MAACSGLFHCGDMPPKIPEIEYGSLKITAVFNNTATDSLTLTIDDHLLGTYRNPHIVTDLVAGKHKVSAQDKELSGEPHIVWIQKNTLSAVTIELSGTAPYPGYHAPDFDLPDISGNSIHLSDYAGKVVFLFFFEHT